MLLNKLKIIFNIIIEAILGHKFEK